MSYQTQTLLKLDTWNHQSWRQNCCWTRPQTALILLQYQSETPNEGGPDCTETPSVSVGDAMNETYFNKRAWIKPKKLTETYKTTDTYVKRLQHTPFMIPVQSFAKYMQTRV